MRVTSGDTWARVALDNGLRYIITKTGIGIAIVNSEGEIQHFEYVSHEDVIEALKKVKPHDKG